jgi:hypothetical protein
MERVMKIGIPLVSVAGLVVVLLGFRDAPAPVEAWVQNRHPAQFFSTDQAADPLLAASDGLIEERDLTLEALKSTGPISAELKSRLAELRWANDRRLAIGLRHAQGLVAFAEDRAGQTTIAELDNAAVQLAMLRVRTDAALAVEANRRDPSMMKECVTSITDSVFAARRLRTAIEHATESVHAGIA